MRPLLRLRPALVVGAAFSGLFLALVLAGSRIHLVPGTSGPWHGVSERPGAGRTAVAALVAGLVVLVLRRTPSALGPLGFLLVAGLPLVPAMTGGFPLLLGPQGALLALFAAAVGAAVLQRCGLASAWSWRPLVRPALLFGLPFLFYLVLMTRLPGAAGPQGDEPHYLVMAHSLWNDGDLDLADEFARREYSTFYAGTLAAHTSPRSPRGRLYSIHAPGLPLLIAPAYALGGYKGAQALMAAFAAATALLVYRLAHATLSSPGAAAVAWASAAFLAPLPFYAVAVYPETPAAFACALVAFLPQAGPFQRALTLGVVAVLPWLHPKLLPLAALGVLGALLRADTLRERLLALLAPFLSWALLLVYFDRTYGEPSFGAAYGPALASDLSISAIPVGLAALLLDRQFGLLLHAPFWILSFVGAWALAKERPRRLGELLLLALSVAAVGAGFSMWWGGACPPTRFLVATVPVLAVLAARGARGHPRLAAPLAGASIAVVILAAAAPRAIHNRPDGQSALLRLLAPALDLDQYLPSFVIGDAPRAAPRPLLRADRATLQLLQAWDPARLLSPLGPTFPRDLEIPLALPETPWAIRPGDARIAPRFDLPPGRYLVRLEGRPPGPEAPLGIEVRSDDLVLADGAWSWPDESAGLDLLLPVGARRFSVALRASGTGILVSAASVRPEAVLARGERALLPWPRLPESPSYRVGAASVRATAIDPTEVEGQAFRLGSASHRFAVDAPCALTVDVLLSASGPGRVYWGGREVLVRPPARLQLPASAGRAFGSTCVVPTKVEAEGGLVAFSEAAPPH